MRLAVFSDSHGAVTTLHWAMEEAAKMGKINAFLFLGDGADDFRQCRSLMDRLNPTALQLQVRGNNDYYFRDIADDLLPVFNGVQALMTHGHLYQAKMTDFRLLYASREKNCRICFFGHTHRPMVQEKDGIWLINPGSVGFGQTLALVDIDMDGIIKPEIVSL